MFLSWILLLFKKAKSSCMYVCIYVYITRIHNCQGIIYICLSFVKVCKELSIKIAFIPNITGRNFYRIISQSSNNSVHFFFILVFCVLPFPLFIQNNIKLVLESPETRAEIRGKTVILKNHCTSEERIYQI